MARPSAVKEAKKRSDKLIEQIQNQQQESEKKAEEAGVSQYLDGFNEDGSQDTGQGRESGQQRSESGEGERESQAGDNAPASREQDPGRRNAHDEPENDSSYRKRYEDLRAEHDRLVHANTVLRGKYESEVPRMAQQIRELKQQLEAAQQQAPAAQGNTQGNTAEQEQVSTRVRELLSEEFPEETVDRMEKAMREMVSQATGGDSARYGQEIADLRQELGSVKRTTFEEKLDEIVPEWRTLDKGRDREAWLSWLAQTEPRSGLTNDECLQHALNSQNAKRVKSIVDEFKAERANASDKRPEPYRETEQTGNDPDPRPRRQKRLWKLSDVQRINAEARKGDLGEFRGKEKQLRALQQDIREAAAEGRIDMNR